MTFIFGSACNITYAFIGPTPDTPIHTVDITYDGNSQNLPLYGSSDKVKGKITISALDGKKVEHIGIKLEFIGQIELYYDRGNHTQFISNDRELATAGEIVGDTTFDFNFENIEKVYESYNGMNVRLRYFLRTSINRQYVPNIVKEQELWITSYGAVPELNSPLKMEVGIDECLHIEFEYDKSKYHLKDVVVGKVFFLMVRIKIKHMEVAIVKRESTGAAQNAFNESETIAKYEVMDGAPVKGECVPLRIFLGGYDLTPTYLKVANKFSVRYFLNLVLIDEEERRYFKQCEINLWRKRGY